MKLKLIKKKVNYLLFLILLSGIIFISGCVQQLVPEGEQGLQIVIKDVGFPEVNYLQPTIKEVQLQNEGGQWITIWSDPAGKAIKLIPDGAETVLDTVSVPAGTYIGTRLWVSTMDVGVDINRDGDISDKNVEIILTLEEFNNLPHPEKPPAPDKPLKPDKPSPPEDDQQPPEQPQEPSQPPEPSAPQEPQAPYRIEGNIVYTGTFMDEEHTDTINDYIVPQWGDNFVYSGSGGKIIYDFMMHPLLPKGQQISVDVYIIGTPIIAENVTKNVTADVKISSFSCSLNTVTNKYGTKIEYVRAIVKGTAQGPVGARVELPILIWSDDKWDCGNWTLNAGALIAVGSTCVRKQGQSETTTWTVDTGGEEQGSWLKGKSRFYSVKIYNTHNDLNPQAADNRTTPCQ